MKKARKREASNGIYSKVSTMGYKFNKIRFNNQKDKEKFIKLLKNRKNVIIKIK